MSTTVNSTDALWAAIKSAHAGDTILMAPGAYAALRLDGANIAGVTIKSLDPTHPAVIAGMNITSSSGLTFSNIQMTVDPNNGFAVMLGSDQNMAFDHVDMHGAAVGNGSAIMVRNSTGVAVTNSDIHDLGTGINHLNSSQLVFSNNSIHNIEADGIRGGGSSNVTISGNQFTNFYPLAADHPDAIQFWTTGTSTATHDLTITNNVFVRGQGAAVQGIFVGNENQITYQNVAITGNAIIGGLYQGIAITQGNNVSIANNLVEGYTDINSWISIAKSTNSTLVNNDSTTFLYSDHNTGFTQFANSSIQQGPVGDTSLLNSWLGHSGTTLAVAPPTAINPNPAITVGDPDGNGQILGTTGNDVIGALGADTMSGGLGNDTYVVEDPRDMVVEVLGGGTDTVYTTLSAYTLPNQVENLVLNGTSAQSGTGNGLNNVMSSNGIRSVLDGAAGNDTLVSYSGLETLTGGAGSDVFKFERITGNVSTITDYVRGQDKLNLHDVLGAYHGTNPATDHWMSFVNGTAGTTVYVDPDGPTGSAAAAPVALLSGVHVTSLTLGTDWVF